MSTRMHVFAVAVEKYQKTTIKPVSYAENDAQAFVKAWQDLGADPHDCVTLLSAHATKASIESSFKRFLSGVTKGDTVVFFFAGHGIAYNDASYLTTHDTQPGDIKATSISLVQILKQIRESKSSRVMMFIDACESGLPVAAGMRSITSNFSGEELRKYCEDAEHHVGFAACKVDESSWSNPSLKHGIWSYSVIRALSGDAKLALEKGSLVTGDSLRDYLADEIPRLLRITRTGNETQTPCFFGNATKRFIVADLKELFEKRRVAANSGVGIMRDSSLLGEDKGMVSDLSAYEKPIYRLSRHTSWEQQFVEGAGAPDVEDLAKSIYDQVKNSFGYKRRDINYKKDGASASIKTPAFDVDISLVQDSEDAERYVLTTQVSTFRHPEVVADEKFLNIFTKYCDTVIVDLESELDIEAKIDEIEYIDELSEGLSHDADCTYFNLELAGSGINLYVTPERIEFSLNGHGGLKKLIEGTNTAIAQITGLSVSLALPNNS